MSYERQRQARGRSGDIGLDVHINTLTQSKLFATEETPGKHFDLAWSGWLADYPNPRAMLNEILEDSAVGPTFSDPAYRHKLAKAAQLSGLERYLTYGKLDLDLARNAAPLAAVDNLTSNDFFSARIGCQTYGIYGMDLALPQTPRTLTVTAPTVRGKPQARRLARVAPPNNPANRQQRRRTPAAGLRLLPRKLSHVAD
jgi:hypothetical protein